MEGARLFLLDSVSPMESLCELPISSVLDSADFKNGWRHNVVATFDLCNTGLMRRDRGNGGTSENDRLRTVLCASF